MFGNSVRPDTEGGHLHSAVILHCTTCTIQDYETHFTLVTRYSGREAHTASVAVIWFDAVLVCGGGRTLLLYTRTEVASCARARAMEDSAARSSSSLCVVQPSRRSLLLLDVVDENESSLLMLPGLALASSDSPHGLNASCELGGGVGR